MPTPQDTTTQPTEQPNLKGCCRCAEVKPLTEFYRKNGRLRGHCKQCHNLARTPWKATPEAQRRYTVKQYYNLTWSAYVGMFTGACGICNRELTLVGSDTCVDHDHNTGLVRGILCKKCNMCLGVLEDTTFVDRATQYLRECGKKG
jgi:Recombination endonuclease VII